MHGPEGRKVRRLVTHEFRRCKITKIVITEQFLPPTLKSAAHHPTVFAVFESVLNERIFFKVQFCDYSGNPIQRPWRDWRFLVVRKYFTFWLPRQLQFTFFFGGGSLASLLLAAPSSDLKCGSCPLSRDWGSHVSRFFFSWMDVDRIWIARDFVNQALIKVSCSMATMPSPPTAIATV